MAPLATSHADALLAGTTEHRELRAGRAVSLQPAQSSKLRLASGCVWATFDGPHHGPANDWGDLVLCAGDELTLGAGQRLVIESWRAGVPAAFNWHPDGHGCR